MLAYGSSQHTLMVAWPARIILVVSYIGPYPGWVSPTVSHHLPNYPPDNLYCYEAKMDYIVRSVAAPRRSRSGCRRGSGSVRPSAGLPSAPPPGAGRAGLDAAHDAHASDATPLAASAPARTHAVESRTRVYDSVA